MKNIDWYFDFISPYSYLQSAVLDRLSAHAEIRRRPVLFGGLLNHWGHLGPAEIPPKREWTFRHCVWLAHRHGIDMTMPSAHPFNPLPLLRLSIVQGNTPDVVDRLFRHVWVDGHVPTDQDAWRALLDELQVTEPSLDADTVKDALRANGADALAAGVFGVPTAVVDGKTFWGFDATEMLLDYLNDGAIFSSDAMKRADRLPQGPGRPQAARTRA